MGNRLDTSSSRYGTPRNKAAENEAREHYQRRAENRPKQKYNETTKKWEKIDGEEN